MSTYLVTWKVHKTVPGECPDYKPNPYTGEYPNVHCLVMHWKDIVESMEKEFATRQEALDFIAAAPKTCKDMVLVEEEVPEYIQMSIWDNT